MVVLFSFAAMSFDKAKYKACIAAARTGNAAKLQAELDGLTPEQVKALQDPVRRRCKGGGGVGAVRRVLLTLCRPHAPACGGCPRPPSPTHHGRRAWRRRCARTAPPAHRVAVALTCPAFFHVLVVAGWLCGWLVRARSWLGALWPETRMDPPCLGGTGGSLGLREDAHGSWV